MLLLSCLFFFLGEPKKPTCHTEVNTTKYFLEERWANFYVPLLHTPLWANKKNPKPVQDTVKYLGGNLKRIKRGVGGRNIANFESTKY